MRSSISPTGECRLCHPNQCVRGWLVRNRQIRLKLQRKRSRLDLGTLERERLTYKRCADFLSIHLHRHITLDRRHERVNELFLFAV